ncbi:site-2 protease family protein [Candidatus Nomurabacteria bacterium]|nr:site-2 protease family protein [Candidatus Nomurabacteria bacterium]
MSILIFIIILLVLVLVHESGHFFTAKSFGIRVDEFGFGFPPKLFSKKIGETEYSINALPFGGFVKIFGETFEEADTLDIGFIEGKDIAAPKSEDFSRSLVSKPAWKQALVLFAGIFANFLLAWLLFSFGFMSGLPTSADSAIAGTKVSDIHLVIISILPKSPAENAGLKVGDKIISMSLPASSKSADTVENPNPDQVQNIIASYGARGKGGVGIKYNRAGEENYVIINPDVIAGKPHIGISMDMIGTAKLPFFTALVQGMRLDWQMTKNTAVGLYTLIADGVRGHGSFSAVTGPVGMVGIVGDAYKFGFAYLLSFAALISINLAIINIIPFPALDGGRLFFLLIEKIKGSRINPKVANMANMIGFSVLILLMLIITYHDVIKFF